MEFSFLDALGTSFVAMIIVFSLLVVLQYVIKLQSYILNFTGKKDQNRKVDVIPKEEVVEEEETEIKDDLQLVAAIAVALSVYLDVPQSNLKIKSIKRINNNSGWGICAMENNLNV